MSSSTPRAHTRAKYKIRFSPYMWVRQLPLATPVLHVLAEAIATAVDPDGCYCWLRYETISDRARGLSKSAVITNINTLVEGGALRNIKGDEQFAILDANGVSYSRDKPPAVLELLIPVSAYTPEDLARVNLMRADRGRAPLTADLRPDITETIGARKKRSDSGKSAPQRRTKKERAAEEARKEPLPPLPEEEPDLEPEVGPEASPVFEKHRAGCLRNTGPGVSETPNPSSSNPMRADPGLPSVARDVQVEESSQVSGSDGADSQDVAHEGGDQGVKDVGGDAARPADGPDPAPAESPVPAPDEAPVPPSPAELVVDGLLRETAQMGATPLADPVEDRRRLVAMAQAALDGGMTPSRLREITSVGLHNVRRQWALATRLADPQAFASVRQGAFGGAPLGGGPVPRQGPLCVIHPDCTTTVAPHNRCAECVEAERQHALAQGRIVEYTLDSDGVWRDHTGTPASDNAEFEGLTEDQVAAELATRDRMRQEMRAAADRAAAAPAQDEDQGAEPKVEAPAPALMYSPLAGSPATEEYKRKRAEMEAKRQAAKATEG